MNHGTIDLRSDTVTRPSAAMRRAMAEAEVGDDVFGEDPTVRRLEERVAASLGMEAGLFVPSGTMGNQIALHLHGAPGAEVVCAESSHVVLYEMGAMAALSGLQPRLVDAPGGLLEADTLRASIPPLAPYRARPRILVIENTFNMAGGRVYDRARLDALLEVAAERELARHLDGARLLNAAVALEVDALHLVRGFDSVSVCLSKGLGAPIGSVLCGRADWIREAWRVRKMFGGGMRQVGVLAAAGLIAWDDGPAMLRRDHEHARRLAEGLAALDGWRCEPSTVETNIVLARLQPSLCGGEAARAVAALAEAGLLAIPTGLDEVRFVTHQDVGPEAISRALEILGRLA
ncbi:MAG: GntG family PLP-dependent aldolase [Acidobacteriota bacterium]